MTYKFLSLLFLWGACISVFGQDLQSPQINQNAIFANPGLAGSKGWSRVCVSTGILHHYDYGYENYPTTWKSQTPNYFTSVASIDGLLFKKSIGFAAYIQNTKLSDEKIYRYSSSLKAFADTLATSSYHSKYSQTAIGIMIAPKFYLKSSNIKKAGRSISPSFAIGIRNNISTLDYTFSTQNTLSDSSSSNRVKNSTILISNVSLGFLYNTTKGYSGIKFGINNLRKESADFIATIVFAHSFSNKNNSNPHFSFNPHGYIALYWIGGTGKIAKLNNSFYMNWGTNAALNLDFRYKKIIFGAYWYNTYSTYSLPGIMIGFQSKNIRIATNVSPNTTKYEESYSAYFSINYLIPPKKQ